MSAIDILSKSADTIPRDMISSALEVDCARRLPKMKAPSVVGSSACPGDILARGSGDIEVCEARSKPLGAPNIILKRLVMNTQCDSRFRKPVVASSRFKKRDVALTRLWLRHHVYAFALSHGFYVLTWRHRL